jgi:hypothetical protein
VYFHTFNEKLADRCGRRPYEEQAYYAGSRYMTLLKPVVTFLLDAEDGAADLGSLAGSAGSCAGGGGGTGFGAGFGTLFAANPPPPQPSASSQSLSPTVLVAPRPPFPRKRRLSQPWPVRLARLPGLLRVPGGLLPSSGRGVHSARLQTSHLARGPRARSPARPVWPPLHPRLRRLHRPSRPRPSR